MIDFSTLKGLTIPEGVVTQLADASGRVLWSGKKHVSNDGEILDSWAEVGAATYVNKYSIGNWKTFTTTDGITVTMEIVAFNADYCTDTGANAPITWITKDLYWTGQHNSTNTLPSYGWVNSAIRARLQSGGNIYSTIPAEVMSVIKTVTKYDQYYYDGANGFVDTKKDKLWIPSHREIFGSSTYEHVGPVYDGKFNSSNSRKKYLNSTLWSWALRTVHTRNDGFWYVRYSNNSTYEAEGAASITVGIALGFCT